MQLPFRTYVGDVTPDGSYWILGYTNGGITPWAQIDLSNSSSPSFGTVISTGSIPQPNYIGDWAYIPGNGSALYAVAQIPNSPSRQQLWRFDLLRALPAIGNTVSYVSPFGTSDGYLYLVTSDGVVYRTRVDSNAPVDLIANNTALANLGDAARCIQAPADAGSSTTSTTMCLATATTVTSSVLGPVLGTSTVLQSGTVPGTVIVTEIASTITTTVTGSAAGTSTIPASGTNPAEIIVTSCVAPSGSTTITASATAGTQAAFIVPACAGNLNFRVIGGAGGASTASTPGGHGAVISGSIVVTPGQIISAIAGGSGAIAVGGQSVYGSGGSGSATGAGDGRGGGGASALYVGGSLSVVAGGGGGGTVTGASVNVPLRYGNQTGDAGTVGRSVSVIGTTYSSIALGGNPGTASGPGTGGTASGAGTRTNGQPGVGTQGGNGVASGTSSGSSGGGGGGYFGGGSGASVYYPNGPDGTYAIGGTGGGGASFIASGISNGAQNVNTVYAPGSVVISYS